MLHSELTVTLPLRLVSAANAREHWAVKAKRTAEQRAVTHMRVRALMRREWWYGERRFVVTITRIGKRTLDGDNLASSAKAVRDGIADALGIDDGDTRIVWRYDQAKGNYGVTVRIERLSEEAA